VVAAAGVDGCRGGWFVVLEDRTVRWRILPSLSEVMEWLPPRAVVGIDMPIGLPPKGGRACDLLARLRLGPRRSAVFPAPVRPVLDAADYRDACRRRYRLEGRRMSLQAWNLVPKIRELDGALAAQPGLAARLREVHPELSFAELAGGRPMARPKRDPQGRAERQALLEAAFGAAPSEALAWRRGRACKPDDVLDAFAALWSARRIRSGRAIRLPDPPDLDPLGLPMCIMA
jgi:predicted RNase H-like nuclease